MVAIAVSPWYNRYNYTLSGVVYVILFSSIGCWNRHWDSTVCIAKEFVSLIKCYTFPSPRG